MNPTYSNRYEHVRVCVHVRVRVCVWVYFLSKNWMTRTSKILGHAVPVLCSDWSKFSHVRTCACDFLTKKSMLATNNSGVGSKLRSTKTFHFLTPYTNQFNLLLITVTIISYLAFIIEESLLSSNISVINLSKWKPRDTSEKIWDLRSSKLSLAEILELKVDSSFMNARKHMIITVFVQ